MYRRAFAGMLSVLYLCAFLVGCGQKSTAGGSGASIADVGAAHPDLEPAPEAQNTGTEDSAGLLAVGAPYVAEDNPYNRQTIVMDGSIYVQETGGIYRVDRATGEAEVLLRAEDGYQSTVPPAFAAFDGYLYFLVRKNLVGDYETGLYPEDAIYRMGSMGGNITEVAGLGTGLYSLYGYEGYLVAYQPWYEPGQKLPLDEQYKLFLPGKAADMLVPISVDEFSDTWFEGFEEHFRLHTLYAECDEVYARMGYYGEGGAFASFIRANDAYYVHQFGSLHRLPHEDGAPVEVTLTEEVVQALQEDGGEQISFVNYDADWLYLQKGFTLHRLRKDGTALEQLVQNGVAPSGWIDVVEGALFYTGTSGKLYVCDIAAGIVQCLDPAFEDETVEVILIGDTLDFIVSPVLEADKDALGNEIILHPGNGSIEIVDEDGNAVHFLSIETGARLTVAYNSYSDLEGWDYPSLGAYTITVHA